MIVVNGFLKPDYGGKKTTVMWNNGIVTGDDRVIYAINVIAENNRGRVLFPDFEIYDWLSSPITFGGIIAIIFQESNLKIVTDEEMMPPPCPEGAVC